MLRPSAIHDMTGGLLSLSRGPLAAAEPGEFDPDLTRAALVVGNSIPYGYAIDVPQNDLHEMLRRALAVGYGRTAVFVPPHGDPYTGPGGNISSYLVPNAAAVDAVAATYDRAILVVIEGLNESVLPPTPIETVIANMRAYCAARRVPGRVEVIAVTSTSVTPSNATDEPRTDLSAWEDTERQLFDADLLAGVGTYWDDVADITSEPGIGVHHAAVAHPECYQGDGTPHLNTPGMARLRAAVFPVVASVWGLPSSTLAAKLISCWPLWGTEGTDAGGGAGAGTILDHWGTGDGVNHLGAGGGLQPIFVYGQEPGTGPQHEDYLSFGVGGLPNAQLSCYTLPYTARETLRPRASGFAVFGRFRAFDASDDHSAICGCWSSDVNSPDNDYCLMITGGATPRFRFYCTPDGVLTLWDTALHLDSTVPVVSGRWYTVMAGLSPGGQLVIRVGDELGNTEDAQGGAGSGIHEAGTSTFRLGGATFSQWRGDAKQVGYLTGVMSDDEWAAYYNGGAGNGGLFLPPSS